VHSDVEADDVRNADDDEGSKGEHMRRAKRENKEDSETVRTIWR
jgi:hypothetical protein